jgi:CSLREA domain-containing protein/uncharacterized repeat protein (TIGR01451 family)
MLPPAQPRNPQIKEKQMYNRLRTIWWALACAILSLNFLSAPSHAANSPAPIQAAAGDSLAQVTAATADSAETEPLDCINPLKAAHIAATVGSVLPIPGFRDAADLAAYGLNLELKNCPPALTAPRDIVITPPTGCSVDLRLPIAVNWNELHLLDDQIFVEILADPDLELSSDVQSELLKLIESEYGRFENEVYGSYINIYGIHLPLNLSEFAANDWGDVGTPAIYHYNSDVLTVLTFPGQRLDRERVRVPAGVHALRWRSDTLFSIFDYVYFPNLGGAAAAGKKIGKEGFTKAIKETIKKAIKEAAEQGAKEFAKKTAKEIAKNIAKLAATKLAATSLRIRQPYFVGGEPHGATTFASQRLLIIDRNPPTISGVQPVTVEALEPGGVTASRHLANLQNAFTLSDDCDPDPKLTYHTPRFWPLGATNVITWTLSDNGARDASGGVNQTVALQTISVVDTKPPILVAPPHVILEATGTVTVPLGRPQVFDVADLRPTISNNAPTQFGPGLFRVQWTATDGSGNVSAQTRNSEQIVNIKPPGTNTLPTAFDQTGPNALAALSFEPITITVRGQDGDNPPDPLWFSIEKQPENGFFIAPLYPYFIDDYRMTARYSPQIAATEGEDFAWELAADPTKLRQYIIQLCQQDINRTDLPKDFVSWNGGDQQYMAVDDDGYTYLYDWAYRRCTHGGSTIAPNGSPRISVWDSSGLYVGEQVRSEGGRPLKDVKFNVARDTIISVESDGSTTGNSLVNISTIQVDNADEPIVSEHSYGLWNKINPIVVNDAGATRTPEYKNAGAAVWDNNLGVLYVVGDRNQNLKGMAAFKTAPCNSDPAGDPEACLDLLGVQVYSHSIVQATKWDDFPGVGVDAMRLRRIRDITLDSAGNIYILAEPENTSGFHRIYKFGAATRNQDGSITLGELIGWMGKCDSGPDCNYIDQSSIGFSCTDETCAVESTLYGDRPGQFDNAAAIAVDPNDVLYVADSGNSRVQRFSPEGLFAGEARSTGDGDSFVLGDFGRPNNIAVNKGSFYIIDRDDEIVHVFDAAVIHGIDETSAWVEYQSKNNFVGTDSFTFAATDGFRNAEGETLKSAPATVEINVTRNFRPPQATAGLFITTTEDTPVTLRLEGYDIDGDLDTLTYQVVSQPTRGSLSGTPPTLTYTPNPDYADEDSFTFTVSDGRFTSAPELFTIRVEPVNDAPVLLPQSATLRGGSGFPVTLVAAVVDPDPGDTHTVRIDWGDGTVQSDETLQGPGLLPSLDVTRTLLAYHHYANDGQYTLNVRVTDAEGATDEAAIPVTVGPMADLALDVTPPARTLAVNQDALTYQILVTNRPPNGGGMTATNIAITETLGAGVSYQSATGAGAACTAAGQSLSCGVGSLAPGAGVTIDVTVQRSGGLSVGAAIPVSAGVTAAQDDPILDNNRWQGEITLVAAADFLVNSFQDGADANPGDGLCATADGLCTLRAAVQEANALAGPQRIALGAGVYLLNVSNALFNPTVMPSPEDNAITGDLDISGDLIIMGLDPDRTVIHANSGDRVFDVHEGATVVIEKLTITGGEPLAQGNGGGLRNNGGNVTLRQVSVTGNRAGSGGGIGNHAGVLTVIDSSLTANTTVEGGGGGGIHNEAALALQNVTLSSNGAGSGGAILAQGGNATLTHVTIYGNSATGAGGGINGNSEAIRLNNTILAGNSAPIGPDCGASIRSNGHNLIGELRDCSILGDTATNIVGESPQLRAAEPNERATVSHDLLTLSRAIDAGSCELATDQRGVERPQGNGCDIGAIEYGGVVLANTLYLPVVHN